MSQTFARIGRSFLPFIVLALITLSAHSDELVVNDGFSHIELTAWSESRRSAETPDLANAMAATDWQSMQQPIRLAYNEDSVWQRITLRRGNNSPTRMLLEVASPLLDELDVYLLENGQLLQQYHLGDTRPANNRLFIDRHLIAPLELPAKKTITIVLRAKSHGALNAPVFLWNESKFIAGRQGSLLTYSFAYGAIFSLLLVFLFVIRGSREPGFHAALLFLLVLVTYQAHVDGMFNQYWPIDGVWWNEYKIALIGLLTTVTGTLLTNRMLGLTAHWPRSQYLMYLCYVIYGVIFPLALIFLGARVLPFVTAGILCYALAGLAVGLYVLHRKLPRAGIYTALAALFLLGMSSNVLARSALFLDNRLLDLLPLTCIVLQVLILGHVLVQRIRTENHARREAEEQALAARKRALAAEWHMAYELEREVERQTSALSQTMKELRHANHQLAEMSLHDGLTGLHNRRYFDERYPPLVQLAARRHEPLTVMMLDIDHFKHVNDDHGHLTGDDCLRQVAAAMRRVLGRSTDLLARYGGEEFVAVLPATGELDALAIAERIRTAVLSMLIPNGDKPLQVTISIGVAVRVPTTTDGIDLLRDADAALYRAKKTGRNRVERG